MIRYQSYLHFVLEGYMFQRKLVFLSMLSRFFVFDFRWILISSIHANFRTYRVLRRLCHPQRVNLPKEDEFSTIRQFEQCFEDIVDSVFECLECIFFRWEWIWLSFKVYVIRGCIRGIFLKKFLKNVLSVKCLDFCADKPQECGWWLVLVVVTFSQQRLKLICWLSCYGHCKVFLDCVKRMHRWIM